MDRYDAIVVGAGPAGGQCARVLSASGWRVLLVEKEKNFAAKDFSSGGSSLEVLRDFKLPQSVVGAVCSRIRIASSEDQHLWEDADPACLVLDFMKLRSFLAETLRENGGELLLSCTYLGHTRQGSDLLVSLKKPGGMAKPFTRQTRVLIDATGSERQVLGREEERSREVIVGLGLEYLLEVPQAVYSNFEGCLSFFIGLKWMPQGYAWIFPMKPGRLKVGVGRNFPDEALVPGQKSFQFYLDHLIRACLKTDEVTVLDKHGKRLSYRCGQKDRYFEGSILAIGDAVSTVNPLTFEGIRHALKSGEIAARHVQDFLEGKTSRFVGYRAQMRRAAGLKWRLSEALTRKIYREPDDEKLSLMLRALKALSLKGLKDLVFEYKFQSAFFFLARCQMLFIRRRWQWRAQGDKRRP